MQQFNFSFLINFNSKSGEVPKASRIKNAIIVYFFKNTVINF